LQTGIYYVAIGVLTLNAVARGALKATVEGDPTAGTFLTSTFAAGEEGWTKTGDALTAMHWENGQGQPPGSLRVSDPKRGLVRELLVVPAKFLGNWAGLVNPRLGFDYLHRSNTGASQQLLMRVHSDAGLYQWRSPGPPPAA
jgi:hypothetical protein